MSNVVHPRGGLGLPARLNIPKEFLARPAKAEFGDAGRLTPRENGAVKSANPGR